MSQLKNACTAVFTCAVLALCAISAHASSLSDLVRLKGESETTLSGFGIVIGLDGTGDDSKDSYVAARPMAEYFRNVGAMIQSLDELADGDSYAIVNVTLKVPATGIHDGEQLDVSVSTLYNATSLAGGRLLTSPLRLPLPDSAGSAVYALAEGQIILEGTNPRSGRVRSGGQMIRDIQSDPVNHRNKTVTLMLRNEFASYPNAQTIAEEINDEFQIGNSAAIARALSARSVVVQLNDEDIREIGRTLSSLMQMPIEQSLLAVPARIVINEKMGTIVLTGDVQIGAVAVVARGLNIRSVIPEIPPTPENPQVRTSNVANLDASDRTSRSSANLQDLINAFEQLNVPIEDQIAIIYTMKESGALVAEIIKQ